MMHRIARYAAPVLILVVLAAPATAQRGGLSGRVLDASTGAPVPDATVVIHGRTVLSNEAGFFSLLGLPAGDAELHVSALGYAAAADTITIAAGVVIDVELKLTTRPLELAGIVVTGAASDVPAWLVDNGFAARRADGRGVAHFTRRDLRFGGGGDLAEVLRHIGGVRIRRLSNGGSELLLEPSPRTDGRPCPLEVYLNGSVVQLGEFHWTGVHHTQRAMRPLRFDDLLRIDEIDGVELYGPGESPVASESACGALLLWSGDLRGRLDEPLLGSVRGSVRDARDAPLEGAQVTLEPGGGRASTDADGRFAFDDLPPGTYHISVQMDGLPPWEAEVEVKAFAAHEIDIRVSERM